MTNRPLAPRTFSKILILIISVGGGVFLIFSVTCLFLSQCYFEYDSTIAQLGICLGTDTEPVKTIPTGTEQLFLCGVIEGSTPRPGRLRLMREGVTIANTQFRQNPGKFFMPLANSKDLTPGEYQVEIGYAKRILGSVEFKIAEK